ncbi:dienelactone hydrolase family protein [Streptomyces sp. NPDC088337]|uniref:dienelactone hydrolase family protein n=1 Tax=unclassified Streptomyces TaxID=2593676 RepID=UPI002DDB73F4|nr:dienelactone hydrolase family protein [Streptomyces sp. NBC_01788]WSB31029.1 dienelactone hydrolase family protein [Streptomyces sp. NBC_01788]
MSERPRPAETPARQNVTFPSAGGTAHGYLALPPSGSGPGVLVIQEWWGLTDHIADVADRLAAEGFVALAPDLYGGSVAHDSDEAQRMVKALPVLRGVELLSGAVGHLLSLPEVTSGTIGAVGFCMGGGFVLYLAAIDPRVSAAVPFYGVIRGELPDFSGLRAQLLGHYGEQDRSVPLEQVEELRERIRRQSGVTADFRLYPAGHAFFNDRRPSHDPDSASRAWQSTVAFLHGQLD